MEGSKKKNILMVVCIALSVAVIVVAAAILIPVLSKEENGGNKISETEEDIFQGYTPFLINSDSMAPALKNGDVLLAEKVKNVNDLKVGEVITYMTVLTDASGNLVRGYNTGRIVDIIYNKDGTIYYFEVTGDALSAEDAVPVTPETVLAKQVGSGVDENGNFKEGLKIENFEARYGDLSKYEK